MSGTTDPTEPKPTTQQQSIIAPPELRARHQWTSSEGPKFISTSGQDPTIAVATDDATVSVVNAQSLSDTQLNEIFDINGILCGSSLATHPTGRLCAEIFSPPDFIRDTIKVQDESSVETHTSASATQAAFAQYGFQEANASVGTPWVSASISASRSTSTAQDQQSEIQYVTAIYRFSRAVIRLPLSSMKPTPGFAHDLDAALGGSSDDEKRCALLEFFSKYGHAIASEVHLGGHLHTTKVMKSSQNASRAETEMELGASISTWVQAGGGASIGSKTSSSSAAAQSLGNMTVEAVGGNTLLGSNLALWPLTLMPYANWRVTKLSQVKLLIDIPSLFTPEQRRMVKQILGSQEVPFDP